MSDGALRISILGDASQFTKTLDQLEKDLKGFQDKLKSATGAEIPTLNLQILGAETSIKQISEFGKFAQGSLGFYQQLKKELEGQLLVTTNRAEQEQLVKRLSDVSNIIKDIKSAGIEKPIPVPIVIEPPPPGSIADIKRQISETIKEKEVAIGVNLTNANVKLQGLRNELSVLEKQGIEIEAKPITPVLENSIQGIKNQIDELNRKKVLIDIANEGEIAEINQELDGLATKLAKANSLSFDKNGQISANAGKSRQALTSLSLVAQDLPFGFIAIQNNLPAVISSFGALSASAVTTKGVLLSLRTALIGPAGIFLAFSVLTAGITYAIQKYGSIGEAVDRLTGKYVDLGSVVKKAAESLKQYNENLLTSSEISTSAEASQAGQILRIRTLANAVLDLSKSESVRKKALDQLKKLDEPRFKNFDIEKGKIEGLSGAVQEYTRAIIAQAVAQKFTDQVSTTTVELEKQRNALGNVLTQLDKYGNFQERLNRLAQEQAATARQGGIPRSANKEEREIQALVDKRKELEAGIVTLATQLNEYNLSAQTATLTAASLASAIEDTGKKSGGAGRKVKEYKKELQGVIPLFDLFSPSKQQFNFDLLKDFFGPNFIKQLKESQKKLNETEKQLDKFRKQNADPILIKVVPKVSGEANNKFLEQKKFNEDIIEMLTKGLNLEKAYDKAIEDLLNFSEYSRKEIEKIAKDLRFLQEPLEGLFTTLLDEGKLSWKAFADDVIKQIKRIAAALLSKAIIQGIANLLSAGAGSIVSRGLKAIDTDILENYGQDFSWLNYLPTGRGGRSANFGGIRGERAMAMTGQVNMVIRGNDLVGVMNRTNTTINRVG